MIFNRRERPTTWQRVREAISPRKGWWRGLDYINKRMRRLPDTPHRVALGFACGAFVSFTPFFGLHFVLAACCAWITRSNILAALFGTVVGNPLTFPFISVGSLYLGRWLLGRKTDGGNFEAITQAFADGTNAIWATVKSWFGFGHPMLDGLSAFLTEVFLPYLIGGILPGLATGAICYFAISPIVAKYQERRRQRLLAIRAEKQAELSAELSAYEHSDGKEGDNA